MMDFLKNVFVFLKNVFVQGCDIVVVGVSVFFFGLIDVMGFWCDIFEGNDLIIDVLLSYWLFEDYYDVDLLVLDKIYVNCGVFLFDVEFDVMCWGLFLNIFFEIDILQVLVLIVVQQVFEDVVWGCFGEQLCDCMLVIFGVILGQEFLGFMVS